MELVTLRRIAFRNGETDHSGMPSSTSISASGPALRSPPDRRVARDHRITWFIYGGLRQAFLRPVIFNLHSGEGLLHVSEQLARFRNPVGIAVAFEFGSQLFVALDPEAMVEDVLFHDLAIFLVALMDLIMRRKDLLTPKVLADRESEL